MPTCKTCKWLDVAPDKMGRIRPRNGAGYRCIAPDPPLPPIPVSMTKAYGFNWPPSRRYMCPEEGEGCPTYEERVPPE